MSAQSHTDHIRLNSTLLSEAHQEPYTLYPNSLTLKGKHATWGMWMDGAWSSVAERLSRILELWTPACRVYNTARGPLILFAEERRLIEPFLGRPVIKLRDRLSTLALTTRELDALVSSKHSARYPRDHLLYAEEGQLVTLDLDRLELLDPARWIIPPDFELAQPSESLVPPPAQLQVATRAEMTRAHYGVQRASTSVQMLSTATQQHAEALRALRDAKEGGISHSSSTLLAQVLKRSSHRSLMSRSATSISRLAGALLGRSAPQMDSTRSQRQSSTDVRVRSSDIMMTSAGAPRGPSLWHSWLSSLERWSAERALKWGLGRVIAQHHKAYVNTLLKNLEEGNLEEVLRQALPLGGEGGGADYPALSLPHRDDTQAPRLRAPNISGGGALDLSSNLFDFLKAQYLQLAAQLEESNEIKRAAFIYADLLKDPQRAVALLERHRQYHFAAELAEDRELDMGWVISLYWRAGRQQRALRLAAAYQAYEAAIAALENTSTHFKLGDSTADSSPASSQEFAPKELADQLRLMWGTRLASAGRYEAAVQVCRRISTASLNRERPSLKTWGWLGVEGGGESGMRLLAQLLELAPEDVDKVNARIITIFKRRDERARTQQITLLKALLRQTSTEQSKALLRCAVRQLARDELWINTPVPKELLQQALSAIGERSLRRHYLNPPNYERASETREPFHHIWPAHDTGSIPIADAALMRNGSLVVALGALGVRHLTSNGQLLCHLDVYADQLIIDPHGDEVICVARRGEAITLNRINLARRVVRAWCTVGLECWSTRHDSEVWFVVPREGELKGQVVGVDLQSDTWREVWKIDIDGQPIGVEATDQHVYVAAYDDDALNDHQVWMWHRQKMRLRVRRSVSSAASPRFVIFSQGVVIWSAQSSANTLVEVLTSNPVTSSSTLLIGDPEHHEPSLYELDRLAGTPAITHDAQRGTIMITPHADEAGIKVIFQQAHSPPQGGSVQGTLTLTGSHRVSTQGLEEGVLLYDNLGRVIFWSTAPAASSSPRSWYI